MADNRLFLRCRRCGDEIPIARLSAGAAAWSRSRTDPDVYDEWLRAHTFCGYSGCLDVEVTAENARSVMAKVVDPE